ncbi:MAG: hypothetical protein IJD94_10155, partial [Clostridia bacterium]|nr:hypothetical protein [Clostridia bacterium]
MIEESSLTAVADAIRARSGTTDALRYPEGFVSAIGAISGGGGISAEDIAKRTIGKITLPDSMTEIGRFAFAYCDALVM